MKNLYLLLASLILAIFIFSTNSIANYTNDTICTHNLDDTLRAAESGEGGQTEFPNGGTTDDDDP